MAIQIKICGISSPEAADAAVQAGADFAGLNFHPKSPRRVSLEQARALSARMKGRIRLVALLVDPGDAEIAEVIKVMQPDYIQLHGRESPARVGSIKSRFGVGVLKVMPIAEDADFALLPAFEAAADMILFDAKASETAERPGGHGKAFDWQLLRGRTFLRPWLLAGGLVAENVARAMATSGAQGVDVSSGVETAPGEKSPAMIRAFIEAARDAEHAPQAQT